MREIIAPFLFILFGVAFVVMADKPVVPPAPTDSAYVKKEVDRGRDKLDKQLRTFYGRDGLPVNRGAVAKGFHRVAGQTTLVSGIDTVALNTSIQGGKNDVSFSDSLSYSGRAWSGKLANRGKMYSILPLTGAKFIVVSSDSTDTATVSYLVEGE